MILRTILVLVGLMAGASGVGLQAAAQVSVGSQAVLLRDVRLIDGTGAAPREHVSLLLRDGRIEQIGGAAMVAPKGVQVRELAGKTVMPGIISAHSHLGLLLDNAEPSAVAYSRENVTAALKQYERFGVTTIMSLGMNRDLVYELRAEQREGKLGGATIFTAGRGVGVPKGAPALLAAPDQIYRPATVAEARADVDELAGHRADIVKVWVDRVQGKLPSMDPAIYKAVIEEAHKDGLRVAAHVYYLDDARQLVADGVDLLAHSVRDQVVDQAFVESVKQHHVWYIPTFTVDESAFIYAQKPAFMSTDFFKEAAGPKLLAKMDAPEYAAKINGDPQTTQHEKDFKMDQTNFKKMFNGGVQVGFGTDSGAVVGRIPGFSEHRELELMVQAGLTPMQAIMAATGQNAKLLRVEDRGTIAVGKRADVLVLDGDPLMDIRNTRRIVAVYHDGRAIADTAPEVR
jgi:imidazolonepropionase-like amidohydrolase